VDGRSPSSRQPTLQQLEMPSDDEWVGLEASDVVSGELPRPPRPRSAATWSRTGIARRSIALLADSAAMGGGIAAAGVGLQEARWTRLERSAEAAALLSAEPPVKRSCCRRLAGFLCSCCGVLSACGDFCSWHCEQSAIYGSSFVAFQILVNFSYGVATSFLYFFLVFYLDQDLGLSPSESLNFQGALALGARFPKPVPSFLSGFPAEPRSCQDRLRTQTKIQRSAN
jgi:hypothetical protein